tara:strand:+ start:636 stop:1109 length:474 start_codon:yes stop_codon:yes gene_type:complete
MQNTGTWNSDEAIFYFFCLISPICLYFLAGFVQRLGSMIPDAQETEISFTETVGEEEAWQAVKDKCLQDAINGDYRAREWLTKNCYSSTLTAEVQPKSQPKQKKKEKTDTEIINEAVSGLVSIGYKKSQARGIVNKLAVSKIYKSSEVLLRDVISGV